MKKMIPIAAATGFVAGLLLGVATPSHAEPKAVAVDAVDLDGQRIPKVNMRIKTDDYLVPTFVCPDADAERYEDCVPWSRVNESVVILLPAVD